MRAMRITFVAVAAATMLCLNAQTIAVYVKDSAAVQPADLSRAMVKAAELLSAAGIEIEWHRGEPRSRNQDFRRPILVHIVSGIPGYPHGYPHSGALAFAQAYEGVHLTVLYDRVLQTMPGSPQIILGYVLAHEITHLLEGICRHSDSGVMKAAWSRADYFNMRRGGFALDSEDIELIHLGIERRRQLLTVMAAR
jgi:hypothetical protein